MNRNIVKSWVFATVLSAGLFSCQDHLLDPVPQTQLSDVVVFDSPSRIALQVNNLYAFVKAGAFLGGRYQVYGDIRSEDFINRTSNGVTGYGVWNHTLTETSQNDVINTWNAGYAAINQINVFLQGMEDNTDKFVVPTFAADFATVTAPRYIAEARFLRAVCYYSLLQLYARPYTDGNGSKPGLPLRLLPETNSLNNDLARSTVAEVYAQILADLNFAEQNLPTDYTGGSQAILRVTRAHRNTAIAFKVRTYLSMGQYANVITEANKIVPNGAPFVAGSGVPHALQANIANVFAAPQETTESIFSFPFTANNTPGTQNQLGFYYLSSTAAGGNPIGGGEFYVNAGAGSIYANLVDFPATDARRTFIYDAAGAQYLRKYAGGTPYIEKAPVIRYPEVLLSLAEAIARTTAGVDARALALLNAVRLRSDVTPLAPADNEALINAIVMERRIEFLGEGIRNQDIMRLGLPIPGKGAIQPVLPSASAYIWPIPQPELATNALITKND